MNNYVHAGVMVTAVVATTAIVSGAGRLIGSLFGVAATSQAVGEEVEMAVSGVYSLPKKSADTPTAFAKAYWDDTLKEVTTTSTSNTLIGVFTEAVAGGVVVANIRLNGVSV